MVALIVLLSIFLSLLLISHLFPRTNLSLVQSGRASLSGLFLFTGISHFFLIKPMIAMIPPEIPGKHLIVLITGVFEIGAAMALWFPRLRRWTGIVLIAFLIAVFPANIYSALHRVGLGGHGPAYLWFRTPLQLLLIGWAWFYVLRIRQDPLPN